MQYRRLGNSSLNVSVLGLGALHFGAYVDIKEVNQIIDRAMDIGINFIDTSPNYGNGNSESIVGKSLKGCRDRVIVSTKAGLKAITKPNGTFGNEVARLTRNYLRKNVENSLKYLRTDYIDLFQLHAFDYQTPMEDTLEVLDELIHEGKIRYLACSNYSPKEFEISMETAKLLGIPSFDASQCQYNIIERKAELELIPACIKNKTSTICNRALSRGILSGKYRKGLPIPKGSRGEVSERVRCLLTKERLSLIEALEVLAIKRGKTIVELALAWLLSREGITSVLVGVRNIEQLESCTKAVEWSISKGEVIEVDKVIKKMGLLSQE